MRRLALVAALAVLPAGCAKPAPGQAAPANAEISIDRGPCFGSCPVYTLRLSADGTVRYDGKRFVKKIGADSARIDPGAVRALLERFDKAKFTAMADRYTHGEPACTRYATDLPTVVIELVRDGKTKRVLHDYGCRGAPAVLDTLEAAVDSIARSERWTGARN